MADKLYRVTWKPGEITVHAATPERAIAIALEYIRVADAGRIQAEVVIPKIPEFHPHES